MTAGRMLLTVVPGGNRLNAESLRLHQHKGDTARNLGLGALPSSAPFNCERGSVPALQDNKQAGSTWLVWIATS